MPADRMLHPRQGHSAKVSELSHLEYRVWLQSLLSADDFGVLRFSAVTLQADNDALAKTPAKLLDRALTRLVKIGLLFTFEHQGRIYACHPAWQDHQKIEYPRETIQPKPTADVLGKCSDPTRQLFALWPKPPRRTKAGRSLNGSVSDSEQPPNGSGSVREFSGNGSRTDSDLARAGARETATATANGKGSEGGVGETALPFSRPARRKYNPGLAPSAAPSIVNPGAVVACWSWLFEDLLQMAAAVWPDEAVRRQELHAWMTRVDDDVRRTGLPKEDEKTFWKRRFREEFGRDGVAALRRSCRRGHQPPCPDDATCTERYLREQREAVQA
jgi:hypothetical protein